MLVSDMVGMRVSHYDGGPPSTIKAVWVDRNTLWAAVMYDGSGGIQVVDASTLYRYRHHDQPKTIESNTN